MKNFRPILAAVLLSLGFLPYLAQAEDIDIYTGSPPSGDVNVVFVLDNESNWAATLDNDPPAGAIALCGANDAGSYFCAQKYALITLLQRVNANGSYFIPDNVGLGIMMYGSGDNHGSYVRFGVRKMTAANRAALIALLTNMPVDDKGSSQQDFGMVMWEAFKYFGGGTGGPPYSSTGWGPIPTYGVGTGTDKRDYSANGTAGSAFSLGAGDPWALDSSSTVNTGGNPVKYIPPGHTTECGKNYLIYIGHSESQANINNNQPPAAHFIGVGAPTGRVNNVSGREVTGSYGDEAARYLFNNDVDPNANGFQNVITYTIGTYEAPCTGQICAMISTMKSMANVGGGSYYDATNIEQLVEAIGSILTEIQGTPSVFISASLPISVNTQGTYLNQVFVGMFQPDKDGSPKWLGNLKQFKIKYDSATGARLGDADNRDAIDATSGFISILARSYWTTPSTFWTNWVTLNKTTSASDSPDGPEVQKGGAAQRQRESNLTSQASRKVYTCAVDSGGAPNCTTGASLSATPFNTTTLDPASTGTAAAFNYPAAWTATTSAATDIGDLIAWVRGTDNLLNEAGPGGTTTVRPTLHGDVLHSRPVALNYGGRVVVFYGSNEGMVRAVEGAQTGAGAGEELWAFAAPDFLNQLNRLRQENPIVVLPSNPSGSPNNKSYFMDGPIGAYQEGSTAIIYVAARRGGRFIYAIDVSNPDDPKFKFKLSPSTTGMSNLGQTWSLPKVTKIRNGPASGRVVLIFGGGYDVAEDLGSAGLLGRGVYVVDALTGAVIKHFLTAADGTGTISTSVPSEVTIVNVDRDPNGFVDRAYVGDLAGNVWRMDLDDGTTDNDATGWTLHKLANLGARKFFFPPDVVLGQAYHAVLIGSGNREDPRATVSSDRFYMLKDVYVGMKYENPDGTAPTPITQGDLVANTADSSNAKGWYYTLNPAGEKVVNAPLTIGGVVYFGTNKPKSVAACEQPDLGEARSYAMNFYDGSGVRTPGGAGSGDDAYSIVLAPRTGLPPSPMFGLVEIGGEFVPVCVGCGGVRRSAFEAEVPTTDPAAVRRKMYWKFKSDK